MAKDREHQAELQSRIDAATADLIRGQEAWRQSVDLVDPDTPAERVDQLMNLAAELTKVRDGLRWARGELAAVHQVTEAREQRERAKEEAAKLNTVFSDEVVLEALHRVLNESEFDDAYAGEVAAALGALPTHSDRIRAGKALRRLADAGKVKRIEAKDSHHANRWSLHA
jgi:hypothetical protein